MRLIDADALKESIDEHVYLVHHGFNETEYGCTQYGIHQIIDNAPTIDAEPVRHGKWKQTYLDHEAFGEIPSIFYCSACCACSNVKTNYCQHCGVRMDEE